MEILFASISCALAAATSLLAVALYKANRVIDDLDYQLNQFRKRHIDALANLQLVTRSLDKLRNDLAHILGTEK